MARELDEQVESFGTRPLDAGPYTFVAADAMVLKVREGGRVVGVHAQLATGVNADGHREILGLAVDAGPLLRLATAFDELRPRHLISAGAGPCFDMACARQRNRASSDPIGDIYLCSC